MALVLLLMAAIWFGGGRMGASVEVRGIFLGLLYIAILGVQVAFPEAHPLRVATGGSAALWLILGGFVGLLIAYRALLKGLRKRAGGGVEAVEAAPKSDAFSESELDRYARHIVLRELGGGGQRALKRAKVLVVGAGGLGGPALQYLGAAGVGTLGVIDDDRVDSTNLQRQVIHSDEAIGMPKVFSAQKKIEAQNPYVTLRPYNRRLTKDIAGELVADYDLVLDGSDNFETRYLVNAACVAAGKPLISGALSQWEGQLSVFFPAQGAPCYRCLFPSVPAPHLSPACAEAGVLGPLPGVIGAMMAVEAVKLITGAGTPALGQLILYDALHGATRTVDIVRNSSCETCGGV
ncbi:MAG: molybdopterin-synthase adenylyltransferase MoeB [Pseudomonadota bacterium]